MKYKEKSGENSVIDENTAVKKRMASYKTLLHWIPRSFVYLRSTTFAYFLAPSQIGHLQNLKEKQQKKNMTDI